MAQTTKAQTWGSAVILAIPLGGIVTWILTSYFGWVNSGVAQVPLVVQEMKQMNTHLVEMREDNRLAQLQDTKSHETISNNIVKLRGDVTLLTYNMTETEEHCDEHIKNGGHK